ncbi:hypothetical protein Tco_1278164, partial [Tanacetum coccineum]
EFRILPVPVTRLDPWIRYYVDDNSKVEADQELIRTDIKQRRCALRDDCFI